MNISNYNLDGNDISNELDDKLNQSNYTETFQTYLEGNDTEGLEDNLDDNFKEELEVLNNDLSEAIKFEETNNITNINTPEESFQKYNVIPNSGLESQLINKPYNVVLYKDVTGTHTFTLNERIKNVVSVKLLSAYGSAQQNTGTAWGGKFFAILQIDELQKNVSAYDASDPTDNDNSLNKLENSFAVLENYDNYQTSTGAARNWYRNEFIHNHDIKYFDPPLPQLQHLNLTIYDTPFTNTPATAGLQLRMNLLIETTEKLTVY